MMHERFDDSEEQHPPSGRGFGAVFATVFGFVAAYQWWHGEKIWLLWGSLAGALALLALAAPSVLGPAARGWQHLGLALARVTTPIVMAVLFFGVVLPTGLALRLLGKDPLRLRRDPERTSYWIVREPPGPEPDSLKNQF